MRMRDHSHSHSLWHRHEHEHPLTSRSSAQLLTRMHGWMRGMHPGGPCRGRTLQYRDGIRGAVRRMLSLHAAGQPSARAPVVLDVGTGSGLLSMIAAKAGAPCIIGGWAGEAMHHRWVGG